jgi:hypothetical protein
MPQLIPSQLTVYHRVIFLLDGSYEDGSDHKSFAYLYHHSGWIEPDTMPPIEILANFWLKKVSSKFSVYKFIVFSEC